jgi:hypothetical protein
MSTGSIVVWVGKERAGASADAAPADAETRYMRLQPPLPADALVDELSQRAAAALFPGVPPTDVDLFLVAREGGGKPTPAAERAATLLGDPTAALADAGVGPGSWLLARLLTPAVAAGAGASLPPPLPPAHVRLTRVLFGDLAEVPRKRCGSEFVARSQRSRGFLPPLQQRVHCGFEAPEPCNCGSLLAAQSSDLAAQSSDLAAQSSDLAAHGIDVFGNGGKAPEFCRDGALEEGGWALRLVEDDDKEPARRA